MQNYPNYWREITASGQYDTEVYAEIAGEEYEAGDLVSCSVFRACFEKFTIGKAYSAYADLSFFPKETIPTATAIKLFTRVRNESHVSDWAPFGTFYIDEREKDRETGLLTVTAFDRMRFADVSWFDGVVSGIWPKTASAAIAEVCRMLGVSLDDRTVLNDSVHVSAPVGLTLRNVLEEVAAAHGGNFVFTHDNKLRLVSIQEPPETVYLGDENGNLLVDEKGNSILLVDGLNDSCPCGDISSLGEATTISKVILKTDDDTAYVAGDDTAYVVEANCRIATQEIANRVLASLSKVVYEPVQTTDTIINPLLELGDTVHSYDRSFAIYAMNVVLDGSSCIATLSAPIQGDVAHEIPIKSKAERDMNYKLAKTKAEIKLTTDSIQSQVTGIDDGLSILEQTVDTITLSVTNGSDRSLIELKKNGITVASQLIRFTGTVIFESDLTDEATVISGDCIQTGEILASYLKLGGPMEVYRSAAKNAVMGGYMGYVTGYDYDGYRTSGMGMMSEDENYQAVVTDAGARLTSPTAEIIAAYHAWMKSDYNIYLQADGYIYDNAGAAISSDREKKENILYGLEKYLPIFDKLQPCSFRYKGRGRQHLGFIAQDVEQAMQDAGVESSDFAALINDEGVYSLRYNEFIPLLVAKVQALENRVKELEEKLNG